MNKKVKQTTIRTETFCDVCGSKAVAFSKRVKKCRICEQDVCSKCAIVTDHWCLEDGSFMGDYPDHYCKDCWEKGKDIREKIVECRENESKLWEEWHKIVGAIK